MFMSIFLKGTFIDSLKFITSSRPTLIPLQSAFWTLFDFSYFDGLWFLCYVFVSSPN